MDSYCTGTTLAYGWYDLPAQTRLSYPSGIWASFFCGLLMVASGFLPSWRKGLEMDCVSSSCVVPLSAGGSSFLEEHREEFLRADYFSLEVVSRGKGPGVGPLTAPGRKDEGFGSYMSTHFLIILSKHMNITIILSVEMKSSGSKRLG
ncbi:uncharacterized protein EV154DRAFT_552964 [Mucor mucedo]|uniref:uncharacterized protein n=1 Tax=Mucor mucedo TaxID=29922 RepID=UPI002220142D|nr:uncharacterized protein EV154DRAFT_552964 [Mucor mucedo]KAI7889594.1 hypothetical protein EV154DRAFT_552964 [Mucor mucedo]